MLEMKITVTVPDLSTALDKLVAALATPNGCTSAAPAAVSTAVAAAQPTPAAPVNPTPPVTSAPVPAQIAPTMPTAAPTPAPAPAPMNAAQTAPAAAPAVPVNAAPVYNLDQIARAGAALVDAGKMEQLLTLLAKFGVQAITQLQPDQLGVFATELRALGAQI